ncbi:MAG: hypothetical protein ACXIUV_15045 [Alkalilacustris sp.]
MTEALPPPLTFEALRREAIARAQEASSELWTDYNLHDPGVTLLEQTCFALTELAYRADLPLRDLLTGPEGGLDLDALGLFAPAAVLRSAPVTRADLETCLGALPPVARVRLSETGRNGLMSARVIPQTGFTDAQAVAAVAAAFAANRPLCTDLAGIETARPVPARLGARIVVSRRALPERVAAEVWLRVGLILRGTPLTDAGAVSRGGSRTASRGATRADVAAEPMLLEGAAPLAGTPGRSTHVAALRLVPDLEEIVTLDLTAATGEPMPDFRPADPRGYAALLPPDAGLVLVQDGVEVPLDPVRLDQEISRLRAGFLASEANRLDPADWAPPRPGVPRSLTHVPVNATLPALYDFRPGSAEARQLAGYRSLIDAMLGAMTEDLDRLPALLSLDPAQRTSHWPHLPRAGVEAGLIRSPEPWSATFARHDRWHGRRAQVLDLLIALQGEAMPAEGRSGIDRDRPVVERAAAGLHRRARFLRALPDINRRRGTGPDGAEPGGVLLRLLCLADLPQGRPTDIPAALTAAGIAFVPDMPTGLPRTAVVPPDRALDLLVPERPAPPMDPALLRDVMPWFAEGQLTLRAFARAALADSWLVAPAAEGGWQILFDPGEATPDAAGPTDLHDAGRAADRAGAVAGANRLRATFAALGRTCEGAWIVEDIRLRGAGTVFDPHSAILVLPGWSLRGSDPAFRRHVARLTARVAPAHCRLRPLWLGPTAFARFAALWADWQADPAAGPALAAALSDAEAAP